MGVFLCAEALSWICFYDIINNSGDSDLIRKAANYGLGMTVNSAKEAAAKAKGGSTKSSDSKSDSDDDSTDSSESKKSSSKSTTEEDFSTDTADDNE